MWLRTHKRRNEIKQCEKLTRKQHKWLNLPSFESDKILLIVFLESSCGNFLFFCSKKCMINMLEVERIYRIVQIYKFFMFKRKSVVTFVSLDNAEWFICIWNDFIMLSLLHTNMLTHFHALLIMMKWNYLLESVCCINLFVRLMVLDFFINICYMAWG